MRQKWSGKVALVTFFLNISILNQAIACTGISLKAPMVQWLWRGLWNGL